MSKVAKDASSIDGTSAESRRAARHRTLKAGKIISLDKTRVFSCQVRNLSDSGAMLMVAESAWIPKDFYLELPGRTSLARCRIARRTNAGIGVEFLEDQAPPKTS
mgnify:CR=1 FL=1